MTDTTELIRAERTYTVHYRDEAGGDGSEQITVDAGTEGEQDEAAWSLAETAAEEWCEGGEWGEDGANVTVWYWIEDDEFSFRDQERRVEVEIEPNHARLIQAAGGEPDCVDGDGHDWTSEGEGGLKENPGVWSVGGTAMVFHTHCTKCGIRRKERSTGSQHNPGEHDTTTYEMPE